MRLFYLLFLFLLLSPLPSAAQKILQIEKYGSPHTVKLYVGSPMQYKVRGDEIWHRGVIEDMLIDQGLIVLEDRYVALADIEAFRYSRGWARAANVSLYTFGLAWSGLALIGTLTDNDPSTSYQSSDAIVTASSLALGWAVKKFFQTRTVRFGEKRRLRMIDITF